ncbi:MAG: biotin synthase BioB [Desulfobacterales bacterium]|nr:biotin synthase BioB [Desulfobacterales bacterium]MBF0396666.1 biotin synthase BioB [Desulfobacterales bacterium]
MYKMNNWILSLVQKVKEGKEVNREEAERLISLKKDFIHVLLYAGTELRIHFKRNLIKTCSIINAKSGRCSEDCRFCAQSAHYDTDIKTYSLLTADEIISHALKEELLSRRFGIVTSGRKLNIDELKNIENTISKFIEKKLNQLPCASLGLLDENDFLRLKKAGLTRYHHNLESSKNFFPQICTTHTYEDKIKTIYYAKKAGLEVCVGGIFGFSESNQDKLDLLFEIKGCDPDSVPLNFLIPIKGTPFYDIKPLSLWEAIKIIAVSRFLMPNKDIKLGAGRLEIFRDSQSLVFLAGANGMIVGNLLTVKGRNPEDDLNLIENLGFNIEP